MLEYSDIRHILCGCSTSLVRRIHGFLSLQHIWRQWLAFKGHLACRCVTWQTGVLLLALILPPAVKQITAILGENVMIMASNFSQTCDNMCNLWYFSVQLWTSDNPGDDDSEQQADNNWGEKRVWAVTNTQIKKQTASLSSGHHIYYVH